MRNRHHVLGCALVAIAASGCDRQGSPPLEQPQASAPTQPAPDLRSVESVLTLSQRTLGADDDDVVVERRRRCVVELGAGASSLRLLQAKPEQVRLRTGADQPWRPVPAANGAEPRELPGRSLLRAWLPSTPAQAGQRWTHTAPLDMGGYTLEVTHVTQVTRVAGGKLKITTRASGERSWAELGVHVNVHGEGQALLADQVPEQITITYHVLATGGPGDDVESSVRYALTLEPEARS